MREQPKLPHSSRRYALYLTGRTALVFGPTLTAPYECGEQEACRRIF